MLDKIIKRALMMSLFVGCWYFVSLKSNPLFVPNPLEVLNDLVIQGKSGQLFEAVKYSFLRITVATSLSVAVSIPLSLIIYNSKLMKDLFNPVINLMRYIPVTAFYPLLIMWFGIDEEMKIAFLFLATFLYMLPSSILCLNEINHDLIDTGATIGMNKLQINIKVILPASLPSICETFLMMYGIGWTYIAVAETINAKHGLGYIIQQSTSRGRTDLVFMSIFAIIFISVVFDNLGMLLIRNCFKWKYLHVEEN